MNTRKAEENGIFRIGILQGSGRKRSLSSTVARAALGFTPEGIMIEFLPHPATLPHYDQDLLDEGVPAPVAALATATRACDALLIVTPEYNWSFPGTLKNAIDWLSRLAPHPLEGRPVAIWSVSSGALGGARAHAGLRQVLHSQGMPIMAKPEVQISAAMDKLDIDADRIVHTATEAFLRDHLHRLRTFCGH